MAVYLVWNQAPLVMKADQKMTTAIKDTMLHKIRKARPSENSKAQSMQQSEPEEEKTSEGLGEWQPTQPICELATLPSGTRGNNPCIASMNHWTLPAKHTNARNTSDMH